MNLVTVKNFIMKLFILQTAIFMLVATLWYSIGDKCNQDFLSYLFFTGAVITGLGTIFGMSANNSVFDRFDRVYFGSSMSEEESINRSIKDSVSSYFQSSLFLTAGILTLALVFLLHFLKET